MHQLKVTPRPSSDLRCAFCHGELAQEARPCRACFTALHDECWDDAGVCPTLGCATWNRLIRIIPRHVGATWSLLVFWLLAFGVLAAVYVGIVPAFAKMFRETGISLSSIAECVVYASSFASSPLGCFTGGLVVAGSIGVFVRHRARRWLVPALHTLAWLTIGTILLTGFALFQTLASNCLCQKL